MESIKSIQENPFYKSFGLKHSVPSSSRNSIFLETPEPTNRRSSNNDDDDIFEYRPVSGFVHKRLDKFSAISAKEELSNALLLLKRSTSLDEHEPEQTKKRPLSSGTILDTKSYLSGTSLSQRAKSVDGLNHVTLRQHQPHSSAVKSKQVGVRQEKENFSISGALQVDRDLSKKNIVIIEKTPPVYPVDRSTRVVGAADVCPEDELPKPNTVLTVRSIFENVASVSGGEYSRRRRSDAPLSPSSPSAMTPSLAVTVNQASIKDQVSTYNLSPMTSPRSFNDAQTKPVFVPTGDSQSKTSDHAKHTSSRSDHKTHAQTKRISQGYDSIETASRENFGSITIDSSSSLSAVIDKADTETSVKQPALSPRSTASVKPTISNQLAPHVKPVPLSPPASVSTSFTKSRPVVSVAPYKDKLDMNNTAQPVIIMSKSQLAPKREKPHRITDYSQESNQAPDKDNNLNNNVIILQDTKNIYNESETTKSHKSSNKKEKSQNVVLDIDSTDSKSDQANIVYTKNYTSIEIKSAGKSSSDKDISSNNNKSETIERPAKADSASNNQLKSKRKAPEPPGLPKLTENNKTLIHISRQSPENFPNKNSSPSSHGQLQEEAQNSKTISEQGTPRDKATAKEKVHPNDTSTEVISKKPSTENRDYEDPPIKGIPSILAQRLKQQKFDPSQVAVDVISSTPGRNNNLSTNSNETDSTSVSKIDLNPVTISNGVKETEPENEIMIVRRRMEEKRSKSGSPTPIFNSSQLSKKNKSNQRQQETVPKLDLSGVVGDDYVAEYQPPQRKIMPCNIVFVGENVKTSRSLLDKNRKFKVRVHFTDTKTDIFEYPREEVALEKYLEEHPEETAEILILQDPSSLGGESEESSDDVVVEEYLGHSDGLKSNTGLSHSGSLQSYKGRFHQDYDFGDILAEQPKKVVHPEPEVDPDKLMLRPAEEEDNTWSTSGTSDILF